MYTGSTVYYLPKPPVASLLMKAMKIVKPTTMLTVPMIIEKVYKGSVLPTIQKSRTLSWMNEHMNGLMCRIIGMKLKPNSILKWRDSSSRQNSRMPSAMV